MSRANKLEMFEREQDIRQMLSEGISIPNMLKLLAKKWKCSESAIRRQYSLVMAELMEDDKVKREELRQTLIMRNDYCYRLALQEGKIKTAIDANVATAKLGGLYDKDEIAGPKLPEFVETEVKDFSKPTLVSGDE